MESQHSPRVFIRPFEKEAAFSYQIVDQMIEPIALQIRRETKDNFVLSHTMGHKIIWSNRRSEFENEKF